MRLRQRKRRDRKPFAVMVADLAAAERLAVLGEAERRLLAAPERPIVLAPRRPGAGLAETLAAENPLLGVMLPNAPLHHLLLHDTALPLVMTSGNRSEEPLAYRDEDALARLGEIADLLLVHDREIVSRCDDSVVRVIAGAPVVLRRGRGHVPTALPLELSFERPVLACGGDLKNAFCVGAGAAVHFGPHVGDLENPDTLDSFAASVARLEEFLHVEPEIVAHDLHPDFHSSAFARARPGARAVAVQHHHAHVAGVMAEHGLDGPVLGVAFDGMGYGPDGTAWGGEFLLADYAGFERLATFRPLPLAGGDAAVRQVWRLALVLLDDAFDGDPPLAALPLFRSLPDASLAAVRQLAERGVHSPLAHGVGRYFDALGALVLARRASYHEGEVAMAWNFAADPQATAPYTYAVEAEASPWQIDLRPMLREAVAELRAGCPAGVISGRFHATLARATGEVVGRLAERHGKRPVVLAGGCFQNSRLVADTLAELTPRFRVHRNHAVPPGDGGLALGQAVVADAVSRREGRYVPRRSG
jgi:hydrogenase maturation protein HypF